MPAKSKAKKGAGPAVDDFDDMLAGFRAQDLLNTTTTTTTTSTSTSSTPQPRRARVEQPNVTVSDKEIIAACRRNDVTQLRRWSRQGFRLLSAYPFVESVAYGVSLGVLRCLVKELGADVNLADEDGFTPLIVAAQYGRLDVVRYLPGQGAWGKR